MRWKQVNEHVEVCCKRLWQAGFEAYPVGGCVRDLLLGRRPGDWDVTTSALPEQVMKVFEHTVPTGVKHGTVTVILGPERIEVTAFRTEGSYSDGRHPDAVCFRAGLEEDLARRDFTINAMALDPTGGIVDLFRGRDDLRDGLIRCVGDPLRRFFEDGLRMFRAVRFGAQLGFELTDDTKKAILECGWKAGLLSTERVMGEVEKILCSPRPHRVGMLFELGLMETWMPGAPEGVAALSRVEADPLLRWAGLYALLNPTGEGAGAGELLRRLRMDGKTIRACEAGQALCRSGLPMDEAGWRRALALYGERGCRAGAAMGEIGGRAGVMKELEAVLERNPCVQVERLALSGGRLGQLGLVGADIGRMQRLLLEHVLDHPEDNHAEILEGKAVQFITSREESEVVTRGKKP